jgi:hypothetical protein
MIFKAATSTTDMFGDPPNPGKRIFSFQPVAGWVPSGIMQHPGSILALGAASPPRPMQ